MNLILFPGQLESDFSILICPELCFVNTNGLKYTTAEPVPHLLSLKVGLVRLVLLDDRHPRHEPLHANVLCGLGQPPRLPPPAKLSLDEGICFEWWK